MKKTFSIVAALLLSAAGLLRADTSYLLIQGPFGAGGATETFKFAINYAPGAIPTGFDLLTTALTSGQLQSHVDPSWGPSVDGFTFNSVSVPNDYFVTGTWWNYYTADVSGGAWTYSDLGASSRTPADGSFDGWVFGTSTFDPETWAVTYVTPIDGSGNTPLESNFAGATQVNAVPEPGGIALVFAGGAAVLALRRSLRPPQKIFIAKIR